MEHTSKDGLFSVGECKDQNTTDGSQLKEDEYGGGDYEALMAALKANRGWLEAKVVTNNAMIVKELATSQHNDLFSVGGCEGQKTVDGEQMPLVLTPSREDEAGGATGYEALVAALKARREWLEGKVITNSAVLLRGFDVRDAAEFNAVEEALGWPDIRYVGPAPRTHVHGRVWTANEAPLEQFIYYHHEMVLIKEFPEKVILFCEVPPPEGGETPFVPSFRVTERALEEFPEMVEELDAKGLRYTFTALSKND